MQFQSAPRLFERGDRARGAAINARRTFQSAPRLFERGDVSDQIYIQIYAVSIRAPLV